MIENTMRRALILDLDFTLLHLDAEDGAIEVRGRTRSAYISPRTVTVLQRLQHAFDIVLATARSWDGARWVSEGLQAAGVDVAATILEDGALSGSAQGFERLEPHRDWERLREVIDGQEKTGWPPFEWQHDFMACLVARAETPENARLLQGIWDETIPGVDDSLRVFRDGRKVYVAGHIADKWKSLQTVLGPCAAQAAGVGDGLNDACWLDLIATPCTLSGAAPTIIELVQNKGGYVSPLHGHDGIVDVLERLEGGAPAAL